MNAFNYSFEEDQLTSVTIAREHVFIKKYEKSSDRILTGCTGGKIKCWDISKTNFRTDKDPAETMRISWYIQAHKKIAGSISSLQVVENYKSDRFIISASTDNNILVHRVSSGVKIGQFNQDQIWNIHDMKPYANIRPNLEREWLKMKIQVWKKLVESRLAVARAKGLIEADFDIKTVDKEKLIELGIADSTGKASVGSASD